MKKLLYILIVLSHSPVLAQSSMVFQRDILTILANEGVEESTDISAREPIRFYTEIRQEQVLDRDWPLTLSRVSDKNTLCVLFDPSRYDSVQNQPISQPLDVLMVSPEGTIVQIMPNLVLSQLAQPIESDQPIRARIILKGGAIEALGIIPGDYVKHSAFHPAPKVLK